RRVDFFGSPACSIFLCLVAPSPVGAFGCWSSEWPFLLKSQEIIGYTLRCRRVDRLAETADVSISQTRPVCSARSPSCSVCSRISTAASWIYMDFAKRKWGRQRRKILQNEGR
ncbi:unnamed protein product, partial [Scytosiphon promiscuus]